MEHLDIVNNNDEVVGRAPKSEIYEKLHAHRIVHVLIFDDAGKMALQKRAECVSFCPGHWSTAVGGHVQSGESYEEAALREFEEELGACCGIEHQFKDFYEVEGRPSKFLSTYKALYNGPFKCNPDEVESVEFFTMEQIKDKVNQGELFHPELLFLINKHL